MRAGGEGERSSEGYMVTHQKEKACVRAFRLEGLCPSFAMMLFLACMCAYAIRVGCAHLMLLLAYACVCADCVTVLEPIGSIDEDKCDAPRLMHQRTQSSFVPLTQFNLMM